MTKQEIDEKRALEAVQLLRRSGVGYIYATNAVTSSHGIRAKMVTLAGSDVEALVKIGLQFAFSDPLALQAFIDAQAHMPSHTRSFRAVR